MTNRVTKAVFPVGGYGTRFLPATKAMPKEMLPVVDKPLIQYAVEEARAAGIEEFIFVTGRNERTLENHFDLSYELEDRLRAAGRTRALAELREWMPGAGQIAYTRQQKPLGLGHAVWCARRLVGDAPFAVLLADDLVLAEEPCLAQMAGVFAASGGNVVATMEVPREHTARYGIIASGADDGRIVEVAGLVEKPDPVDAPSTSAVIGRYILLPEIFEFLDRQRVGADGEVQLTDALARMIGTTPLRGLRFEGERFDCGDKVGFLQANLAFGLARPELRDELGAYVERIAGRR
ncbi:MAG: UTP--glucose-1-phosphate uridylyltransferase GalU [Alphaproteobacteria bacterium]|nr:UTP--glucose-1-phosphate uridylyltransferase GalU [Alphaproteobacteria bacterium]